MALFGLGLFGIWGLSRIKTPVGYMFALHDEVRRVDKQPPKTTKPPPIPNVPQDAPTSGLVRILVSTAQAVLWKLGAADISQSGVFDLHTAQAWQEAALLVIGPSANAAFERADNERAWVDPKVANRLLEVANDGHRPFDPAGTERPEEPADTGGPPPIPDVQTPSPNAAYQIVRVATAQIVLKRLGAEQVPNYVGKFDDGVWNFETQRAWQVAAAVLSPSTDPAFERASNLRAWVHPATAAALAKAANDAKNPFAQGTSSDVDAFLRAAQAAARGEGEDDAGNLGVQTPVPPLHLPNPPPPPKSPATPINLERARQTAPKVDREVKGKRDKYSRKMVEQFQADAGLVPDGLYGPITQSALRYFGVRDPAKPVFRNTSSTTVYTPPS